SQPRRMGCDHAQSDPDQGLPMAVRPARAGPPPVTTRTRPIVAGLMLSMFLVALDGTIVSTAMPSIVGNLGGFALYAWVPSIYLLTTAVTTWHRRRGGRRIQRLGRAIPPWMARRAGPSAAAQRPQRCPHSHRGEP